MIDDEPIRSRAVFSRTGVTGQVSGVNADVIDVSDRKVRTDLRAVDVRPITKERAMFPFLHAVPLSVLFFFFQIRNVETRRINKLADFTAASHLLILQCHHVPPIGRG